LKKSYQIPIELIFITAVSLTVRWFNIGTNSYWLDEAYSLFIADYSPSAIWQNLWLDPTSPFYYLQLHFWINLFGNSEVSTRMLSAVFGVGANLLVYGFAKPLGKIQALGGAMLIAISPLLVWYAQETRAYSMLLFYSVAAWWVLWLALQSRGRRYWAGWLVLAGLMCISHYTGVFVLAAQVATIIIWLIRHKKPLVWGSGLAGLAVIGGLGWWAVSGYLVEMRRATDFRANLDFFTILGTLPDEIFDKLTLAFIFVDNNFLKWICYGLFSGLFGLGVWWLWQKNRVFAGFLLAWFGFPVLGICLLSLWVEVLEIRYVISVAIPYYLLIAYGLGAIRRLFWRRLTVGLTFGIIFTFLVIQYKVPNKPDFRSLTAFLEERANPQSDVIVYYTGYMDLGLYYYVKKPLPLQIGYPIGTFSQNLGMGGYYDPQGKKVARFMQAYQTQIEASKNIWLVQSQYVEIPPLEAYFNQNYRLLNRDQFNLLVVLHYKPDK
jgi:4-amino-4-deoxy-L-arabinose transferase-like glycosyltransferase